MSRLVRSLPRRSPKRYPVGSTLTLRDGRVFKITTETTRVWDDPTYGTGGGNWISKDFKVWREVEP